MTNPIRINSIRLRFWLPLLMLIVVGVLVAGSIRLYHGRLIEDHAGVVMDHWEQSLAVLQQEVDLKLAANDGVGVQRLIASFSTDSRVQALALIMPDGRVGYANNAAWRGRSALEVLPGYGVTENGEIALTVNQDQLLTGYAPLAGSGALLYLRYSAPEEHSMIHLGSDGSLWGLVLLPLILLAFMYWVALRFVSRPLALLGRAVDEYRTQGTMNLEVRGRGEVARVGRALIGMSQAVSESDNYLSDILRHIPSGLSIKDRQGRILFVNPVAERMAGRSTNKEIIGQLDSDLWPEAVVTQMHEQERLVLGTGVTAQYKQRLVEPSGATTWAMLTKFPLKDGAGEVYAVGSMAVDITEEERLRQQLIGRQERLEMMSVMAMELTGDPLDVMPKIAQMMTQTLGCHGAGIIEIKGDQLFVQALQIDDVSHSGLPPMALLSGGTSAQAIGATTPQTIDGFYATYRETPLAQITDLQCAYVCPVIDSANVIIASLILMDDNPIRLSDDDQKLMGIVSLRVALEMARLQVQQASQQNEQRHRSLIELTQAGFCVVNANGHVSEANEQYLQLTGRTNLDEILGHDPHEWHLDPGEVAGVFEGLHRTGGPWSGVVEFTQPDGSIRPVTVQATTLETPEGRNIAALVWDATDRLTAEQQRLREQQMLQLMIDSMQNAVISIDGQGSILSFNHAAEVMFGHDAVEVLGRNVKLLMPEKVANAHDGYLQRYLVEGDPHIIGKPREVVGLRGNGQEFPLRLMVNEILNAGGNQQFVGSIEDLTEQNLNRAMLQRAQKMEAVGQLSSGIAHDFNNQLGVVQGYLNFLGEALRGDDKFSKWVEIATGATRRCVELTRQLLDFSRRAGDEELSSVDVNAAVSDMEILINRALTPGITLTLELAPERWFVVSDRGELQDALLNFSLNARDAMRKGGELTIRTQNLTIDVASALRSGRLEPGQYVQITIQDTGTGMLPEVEERLFEPFFTTKPEGEGTGLGLSMVWGFVQRCAGQINVYSELGSGTRFSVYLPRCAVDAEGVAVSSETDSPASEELPQGNERILVVDDEPMLRELAVSYLHYLGYSTLEAEDGRQALGIMASDEQIDLVFSDVIMPNGVDGFEVAEVALQRRPQPKVLLASGFLGHDNDRKRAEELVGTLLDKPYDLQLLAQAVRKILDS